MNVRIWSGFRYLGSFGIQKLRKHIADHARDLARHVQAVLSKFELAARVFVLFAVGLDPQRLLRTLARFLRFGDVDLLTELGDFGENRHFIRQHFGESPRAGKVLHLAGGVGVTDLADGEFGDERGVSGQDTDLAVAAGDGDLRRIVADEPVLGGDDFEFDNFSHLVVGRWSLAKPKVAVKTQSQRPGTND